MTTTRSKPFELRQGDTVVTLDCTCERLVSGVMTALNLTGYSVTFSMRNAATGTAKTLTGSASIVTAASGLVRFTFTESDVDTPGIFWGSFVVSSGGAEATFPVNPKDCEIWVHGHDETAFEAYKAALNA
jgi:hypothetical protein